MVVITELTVQNIPDEFILGFRHEQVIPELGEVRRWSREKRLWIAGYLRQQIQRGGTAVAAWEEDTLLGFACADGFLRGERARYANLTMLFVDDVYKRRGIGGALFREICTNTAQMGAEKLFISAIPSVETIAFYRHMGCADAQEIIDEYVDTEHDRYLEYDLTQTEK